MFSSEPPLHASSLVSSNPLQNLITDFVWICLDVLTWSLANECWWTDRPTLFFLPMFFLSFLIIFTQGPVYGRQTASVTPVTFLISSELFSMLAVKRFSVSFARHPTNGMSAFIKVHFDSPPVSLLSCMTLSWENISCVFFLGFALMTPPVGFLLKRFCSSTLPGCLLLSELTSNTTCSVSVIRCFAHWRCFTWKYFHGCVTEHTSSPALGWWHFSPSVWIADVNVLIQVPHWRAWLSIVTAWQSGGDELTRWCSGWFEVLTCMWAEA